MKLNYTVSFFAGVILVLTSCSSSKVVESNKEEVVSRIDNLNSRPDWLKESESFKIEDGQVISLGSATIPGDDRIESGIRVSENNAKIAIASGIEQKIQSILQNAEEGTQLGADQLRFIGSEVTSLTTSSIHPYKRYWEKYIATSESGTKISRYRIFSTVVMPESEFKKAVLAAINKAQGKKGISKSFAEKVDKQWDSLVNSTESQPN